MGIVAARQDDVGQDGHQMIKGSAELSDHVRRQRAHEVGAHRRRLTHLPRRVLAFGSKREFVGPIREFLEQYIDRREVPPERAVLQKSVDAEKSEVPSSWVRIARYCAFL